MSRKISVAIGMVIILILGWCLTHFGITPTDTRIIRVFEESRDDLLSVVGVVGAVIARDQKNHIIGIAVYVNDDFASTRQLPGKLGEFDVSVKIHPVSRTHPNRRF